MMSTPSRQLMTPSPPQNVPSSRNSSHKSTIFYTIVGLVIAIVIACSSLATPTGADSPQCRSIYMYPSYAHLNGFDQSHTKLATKYNLYLYREQGKDKVPDTTQGHGEFNSLDGIPVLFIPGNAGSFKQVRSIAAEAANIHHNQQYEASMRGKNMDFFAAHFNEDFTAFHGRTMLDQAEYLNDAIAFILSLYSDQKNPPKSVILLGHSMGGVVSRVMLTLPNYVEGSVNTIITLAAPHAAAPATFDGDIMRIYAATDTFWRAGFNAASEDTIAKTRLKDVSLISITGGLSDTILPADYTTLRGLVPDTHGFTVYSTGIPNVWTPIDHLAIVWCDQFRKVVASTLFDIVDPTSETRTIHLTDRMRAFRRGLLSGFEDYGLTDYASAEADTPSVKMAINTESIVIEGDSQTFRAHDLQYHAFSISDLKDTELSFLATTKPLKFDGTLTGASLLLCNTTTLATSNFDETDFNCIDIANDVYPVPNPHGNLQDSSAGGFLSPFYAATIPSSVLKGSSYVIYRSGKDMSETDFAIITITSTDTVNIVVDHSPLDLLLGSTIKLPSSAASSHTKITYTGIWSSLYAYKLQVILREPGNLFPPFLNQVIQDPMETKWHLSLDEPKHISFHGVAPYTPYRTTGNPLSLNLYTPPNSSDVTLVMKIDIVKSLKLLVIRYRLAIASMPLLVILLTLIIQFRSFHETGIFPLFEDGLTTLASKNTFILVVLTLLVPLGSSVVFQKILYLLDPIALTSPNELDGVVIHPYYLGLPDKSAVLLGSLFYLISFAAVSIVLMVMKTVLWVIPAVITQCQRLSHTVVGRVNEVYVFKSVQSIATGSFKDKRRLFASLLLLIFVMFYIPYQFAYVVCCCVQIITTIKTHMASDCCHKEKVDIRKKSIANFNLSLLILMVWVIPVNAPVLVVFFHNMAVRWRTPFTSHHNILAVLPTVILVGRNVQGGYLPVAKLGVQKRVTLCILAYFAFFTLIYGIRHLYWLHYLLNFFAAWLVILSFWTV